MRNSIPLLLYIFVLALQNATGKESISFEQAIERVSQYYMYTTNVSFSANTTVIDSTGQVFYKDSVYVVKSEPYFYYVNGSSRLYYGPDIYLSIDDETGTISVLDTAGMVKWNEPGLSGAFIGQIKEYIGKIESSVLAGGGLEYKVELTGYPYYSGLRVILDPDNYRVLQLILYYPSYSPLSRMEVRIPHWNAEEPDDLEKIRRNLIHIGTSGQHLPGISCPDYTIITNLK